MSAKYDKLLITYSYIVTVISFYKLLFVVYYNYLFVIFSVSLFYYCTNYFCALSREQAEKPSDWVIQ